MQVKYLIHISLSVSYFSRNIIFLTVRGGIIECYRPHWNATLYPDEILHFLDKDGQYGFIAMTSDFPVGEYKVNKYSKQLYDTINMSINIFRSLPMNLVRQFLKIMF